MTRRTLFPCLLLCLAALNPGRPSAAGPDSRSEAHPAFEGIWNSATATPLERPVQWKDKAFLTPEEAAAWERQVADRNQEPSPEAASTSTGTGTYNTFFREFGARTVKTRRTSIVTDPPDGRIPPLAPLAADAKRRRLDRMKIPANAEDTGLQDQCLAFVTAGPPMLPYSYNSNYQIVQTRDAVVVHAEMIHDARVIHLDGRPHLPSGDQAVDGRLGRSLGGRHAGGGHDELQRRRRFLWGRWRQLRVGPESARRRAVQPARPGYAALQVRDRRFHRLHPPVEG